MTTLEESIVSILKVLEDGGDLPPQDKLGHRIMMTIQRRRACMDWLVDGRSRGRVRPRLRRVLWWALAELLWMNGVPSAAVVNVAVSFVKQRYSAKEAPFVNGLLRGILRDLEGSAGNVDALLKTAPVYVKYCLPEKLWQRWKVQYGAVEAERIAACLLVPAKTILRRRQWPKTEELVPSDLCAYPAPEWAEDAELYEPVEAGVQLEKYMGGKMQFYIQDMATLLAPALLAANPDEDIADLCAAPGGKALLLGEAMKGKGHLLCCDKDERKLPRLRENLSGLTNVEFECQDAMTSDYEGRRFDAIMLDVPCSNTGVIRRKPDVRWNFNEDSFRGLLKMQRAILENGFRLLKGGGRLVYSTCSIEQEENQKQVEAFVKRHPEARLETMRVILPTDEHDGAFASLITKTL